MDIYYFELTGTDYWVFVFDHPETDTIQTDTVHIDSVQELVQDYIESGNTVIRLYS